MPREKLVIYIELFVEQLKRIVGLLPCSEAQLYFQAEPGPPPEFTDPGMDGLCTIIELNVYYGVLTSNTYHVWWRKVFHDEWKLLF